MRAVDPLLGPRLLIVADLGYVGDEAGLLERVAALAPVAVDPRVAIQLGAKALGAARLGRLAAAVRARAPAEARLLLNGDAPLAQRLGYSGTHWPEAGLPARVPAEPRWHCAAVHSAGALKRAERASVQAAVFGPVFAPGSKAGAGRGLTALRAIARAARCSRSEG